MSLHVCILGIDGSGKSTVVDALPDALAGFSGLRVASAGGRFRVADPDQTLLAPDFHPYGLPVTARGANVFRKLAKLCRNRLRVYPLFKIAQLACQDAAARRLERRYQPDVVVSEGNLILSVIGRAANYLRPARLGGDLQDWEGDLDSVRRAFAALDGPVKASGWVGFLSRVGKVLRKLGFHSVWLPDVVILLDLSADEALQRIQTRGARIDPHENARDLSQARSMYTRVLNAMSQVRGKSSLHSVPVGAMDQGKVLQAVTQLVRRHVNDADVQANRDETLGRVENSLPVWLSLLKPGYLANCLAAKFFRGTWREPLFPLCRMGRRFMKEGYSGKVMQDIYDQDVHRPALHERPFMGYPLHRAVYDRLHLLVPRISRELASREGRIRVLSAPCGLADDVFRSVERVTASGKAIDVEFTALDLDPNHRIGGILEKKAAAAGADVRFVQGDITSDATWTEELSGPYDIVVFVGLSGWLPKPALVQHMARLRRLVKEDGVLVTDAFTAGAYALSGHYAGYRAHYYEPSVYASLLSVSGFEASADAFKGGRDGLNHVVVCSPKPGAVVRKAPSVLRPTARRVGALLRSAKQKMVSRTTVRKECGTAEPIALAGGRNGSAVSAPQGWSARKNGRAHNHAGWVEAAVSELLGIPYVLSR